MQIIPAIDLKDGKVVRLARGDYDKVKVYSEDPVEVAKRWQSQGAGTLHVVDLDGALAGRPINMDKVTEIVESVSIPVELGGGLRSINSICQVFDVGIAKVVLGSKAVEELDFVTNVIKRFKDKIIVSIDSKDGFVMLQGWTKISSINAIDLAKRMEKLGAFAVIYTDVTVDGTLSGPNFARLDNFLSHVNISVIVAGGIASLDDIKRLRALNKKNLAGVIIGKALYEGSLNLKEATAECSRKG